MADSDSQIEHRSYSLDPRGFQHLTMKQWDEVGFCVFQQAKAFCGYIDGYSSEKKRISNFDFNRIHRRLHLEIEEKKNGYVWYDLEQDFDEFRYYLDIVERAYSKNSDRFGIADFLIEKTSAIKGEAYKIRFLQNCCGDILRKNFSCRVLEEKTADFSISEWYLETTCGNVYRLMDKERPVFGLSINWTQSKKIRDWCLAIDKKKLMRCGISTIESNGRGCHVFDSFKRELEATMSAVKSLGFKIEEPI